MPPLSDPAPVRSTPSDGQNRDHTFQGAPPARLEHAGGGRAHRVALERLLVLPGPEAVAKPKKTTTTTTAAPAPACPLTGVPAPAGSVPQRPAMAVKIDNYPAGRPQSGLDKADIIFEEPVEGGITRFAAVFQCQDSALIGPVRSARNIDIGILGQLGSPLLAHVGGINPVLANINASPIVQRRHRQQPVAHDPPGRPRTRPTLTTPRLPSSTARTRP